MYKQQFAPAIPIFGILAVSCFILSNTLAGAPFFGNYLIKAPDNQNAASSPIFKRSLREPHLWYANDTTYSSLERGEYIQRSQQELFQALDEAVRSAGRVKEPKSLSNYLAFEKPVYVAGPNSIDRLNAVCVGENGETVDFCNPSILENAKQYSTNVTNFRQRMTTSAHKETYRLLSLWDDLSHVLRIVSAACGGTAIGAYRHGELIPWDDDVDYYIAPTHGALVVYLCNRDRTKKRTNFAIWQTEYEYGEFVYKNRNFTDREEAEIYRLMNQLDCALLSASSFAFMKLFLKDSPKPPHSYPWKYPFIDLFAAVYTPSTQVFDFHSDSVNVSAYDLFPVIYRRFGSIYMPVSRNTRALFPSKREKRQPDTAGRDVSVPFLSTCIAPYWDHERKRLSFDVTH